MTRKSQLLVWLLAGALIFSGLAGMAAPGTGRLPWSNYQDILRLQVMAPGAIVPEKEYVFQIVGPITEEQAMELEELGITLIAAVGDSIRVKGSATSFEIFGPEGASLPWVLDVRQPLDLNLYCDYDFNWLLMDDLLPSVGGSQLHALGLRGEGANIGILDTGFTGDLLEKLPDASRVHYLQVEYSEALAAPVLREGFSTGDHGEACSQAIASIAPDATFYLMSAPSNLDRKAFLQFIRDGEIDIDILSESIGSLLPEDHNDGTGPWATLGAEVVASGVTYFHAVGNMANGEMVADAFYRATFSDTDGDGFHDFTGSADAAIDRNSLEITVEPWEQGENTTAYLVVCLEWDGWAHHVQANPGVWTTSDIVAIQDIDLHISYRTPSGAVIPLSDSSSVRSQLGILDPALAYNTDPTETIYLALDHPGTYLLQINNVTMSYESWLSNRNIEVDLFERDVDFHLYVYTLPYTSPGKAQDGDYPVFTLEHFSAEGSLINMGAAKDVIGVGAVGWVDSDVNWHILPYSSRGPTTDGRIKPDLVAPTLYESIATLPAVPYFSGTSAAAPVAAGLAALLVQVNPSLQPVDVRGLLCASATDICGIGCNGDCNTGCPMLALCDRHWSHVTGWGLVNALAAYQITPQD
ncbi:S8 family serine peptidase [Candidatus Bipolaricaulota bacterium]|nr:S8 family serine peptidase [Candidatus Bipolaricaulota bacterium]